MAKGKLQIEIMTDEEIKAYFDKVDDNIKTFGYHLTYVFGKDTPSFCYSTGIYKNFNIPEIFISSLPQGLSSELIENCVKSFNVNQPIPLNEKLDYLIDRFPVYLIEVPILNVTEYVLSSIRFYKDEEYKYLQVIYPPEGNFPNDIGYDYDQEIMGVFNA